MREPITRNVTTQKTGLAVLGLCILRLGNQSLLDLLRRYSALSQQIVFSWFCLTAEC